MKIKKIKSSNFDLYETMSFPRPDAGIPCAGEIAGSSPAMTNQIF